MSDKPIAKFFTRMLPKNDILNNRSEHVCLEGYGHYLIGDDNVFTFESECTCKNECISLLSDECQKELLAALENKLGIEATLTSVKVVLLKENQLN